MRNTAIFRIIVVSVLVIMILGSIFGAGKYFTKTETYSKTIEKLDEKRNTVIKLTAASTGVSMALTFLPDDIATPVAEQLTNLSTYFMWALCAILVEKYMLTVTGFAACYILFPLAFGLWIINIFRRSELWTRIIIKIIIFAIVLLSVIPISVKISNLIEETYGDSIETTISSAEQTTEELQTESDDETEEKEEKGVFDKIKDTVSDTVTTITTDVSEQIEKAKNCLNNFIEAIAVMLVTTCIIPILVIVFFIWLTKIILGINIGPVSLPRMPNMKKVMDKVRDMD